ncbi:hypothetical protein G1H11_01530 [Phytoactinopolyspora alkaliphila]|uniref:ABC3 transporter permease C-terminal domain-containing protein n=1 Tax=Phytoactinopolyspora alkaliphila TaxID=1783498 RepID=A0A6N9YGA6_9ACTN|nr:FtsX-like permease family protein [Phytoactinopolyspora alkaliphila]NED93994.1 hypothetical protein [Phytoactinopolyspora alkaliphila]
MKMQLTKRHGAARILIRQAVASRGAGLVVILTALLVAGMFALWPRVEERLFTENARDAMAQSSAMMRDLVMVAAGGPPVGEQAIEAVFDSERPALTVDDVWGASQESVLEAQQDMPGLLRRVTGGPRMVAALDPVTTPSEQPHPEFVEMNTHLLADPDYAESVSFVEGTAPGFPETTAQAEPDEHGSVTKLDVTVEIALSAGVAQRYAWQIGEARTVYTPQAEVHLELTGVFEAVDPDDGYWLHVSSALEPLVALTDPGLVADAHGFISPEAIGTVWWILGGGSTQVTRVWFPIDASTLHANEVPALIAELRAFNAAAHPMLLEANHVSVPASRFATGSIDILENVRAERDSAVALTAMVVVGPAAVGLAVLALASKLVVGRRRRMIATMSARGASAGQLRAVLAVEGVLLGLVPTVAATVAAARLVDEPVGRGWWLVPIAVGLVPIAMFVGAVRPAGTTARRFAAAARLRGWVRRTTDVLVVGCAAVAVILLRRRGLDSGTDVDPLLVATPLLVMVAACIVVLRVYPLALRVLARSLEPSAGTVTFVGSVRSGRERVAAVPVLALVAGLAIAVFTSVLLTTIERGAESAAWADVGADVRASSARGFADDAVESALGFAGVDDAVAVTDAGTTDLFHGTTTTKVRVLAADTSALASVQADVPGAPPLPADLSELRDGVVPAVAGGVGAVGIVGEVVAGRHDERVPVTVVQRASGLPGLSQGEPWLLVDVSAWENTGISLERPRIVLMRTSGEVDQAALAATLNTNGPLVSPPEHVERFQNSGLAGDIRVAFMVSVAFAGLLAAASITLTLILGAPARGRLLSVLRTLGITGRQAQGLVAWEMGPVALLALLFGVGLGAAVPGLVLSGVDLRPFTGGREQPGVEFDYGLVAAAVGAFIVLVAVVVGVAATISGRLRLGEVLRVGEDGA